MKNIFYNQNIYDSAHFVIIHVYVRHLIKRIHYYISNRSRNKTAHGEFSGISFLVLHAHFFLPQNFIGSSIQSLALSLQKTLLHLVVATLPMVQMLKAGLDV